MIRTLRPTGLLPPAADVTEDLAAGDRFEVFADCFQMFAGDKGSPRFDDGPGALDEVEQRFGGTSI